MNYKQQKPYRRWVVPPRVATMAILVFAFCISQNLLYAEGSIDFRSDPGFRLFYFAEKYQQIKVYAGAGEFINMGASHIGISGGTMSIYRPNGTLHTVLNNNGATAGLGIINNDIEELNGPTGGGTTVGPGYIPGVVEVQAGEEGIWTVLLEYPFYNNVGFPNLLNSDPWTRAVDQPTNRRVVLAWDVTVSKNAAGNNGGDLLKGRIYSNEYQSIVSQNGNLASPSYYILTADGYQYNIEFDDIDPWGFPVFSNTWGIVNSAQAIQPTYKSHKESTVTRSDDANNWQTGQNYLYEPQARDIPEMINNKVFFNIPDPNMPNQALVTDIKGPGRTGVNDTHTTWLYSIPTDVILNLNDVNLFGLDENGDPLPDGVIAADLGAFIDYETNIAGTVTATIDLDRDGIYGNGIDKVIFKRATIGAGTIFWDGKDANGNQLTLGLNQELDIRLEIAGGELHLMVTDVGNIVGGIGFTRINGENAPVNTYLFNHEDIGGAKSGSDPFAPQPTSTAYTYDNNFGDGAIFDYWTYVKYAAQTKTIVVDILDDPDKISADSDMDGVRNDEDIDDDNDGIPDVLEYCPDSGNYICLPDGLNPAFDEDLDGIPNYKDASDPAISFTCVDNDNDGICDQILAIYDLDGDNIPNHLDLDSDNDGISDLFEANHNMIDLDGDGRIDGANIDFGDNGLFNMLASDANDLQATQNYIVNDADQDGVYDAMDLDSDNDGLHDMAEAGYASIDENNNGTFDDGENNIFFDEVGVASFVSNLVTGQSIPIPMDSDSDQIVNYRDLDSDNDGITDVLEGGNEDEDFDGEIGKGPLVIDNNGVPTVDSDGNIAFSTSVLNDQDNDAYPNYVDHDSDNDGIHDTAEAGYKNNDIDDNGFAGTGVLTTSINGLVATSDNGPFIYNTPFDTDTDILPNYLDLDSDNDGIHDVAEGGNEDPEDDGIIGLNFPNTNNFGVPISDNSGSTFISTSFPPSSDSDPIPDFLDLDSDNDGINDVTEGGNEDPDNDGLINSGTPMINPQGVAVDGTGNILATSYPSDSDGDGYPSYLDLDSDNDGINDVTEGGNEDPDNDGELGLVTPNINPNGQLIDGNGMVLSTSDPKDFDGDMIPDYQDLDSDNDGIHDVEEAGGSDPDNDGHLGVGIPNTNGQGQAVDGNGNVIPNSNPPNSDGTGEPDYNDLDSDGDGIEDVTEADFPDTDGDGIVGSGTPTVDEDGLVVLLDEDGNPIPTTSNPTDTDGDGIPDYQDIDSDNDGDTDNEECPGGTPCPDSDNDGVDDWRDSDCIYNISQPTLSVDDQSCVNEFIYFSIDEANTYETTFAPNPVSYTYYNGAGQVLPGSGPTYGIFATDTDLIYPITVVVSVEDCDSAPSAGVTVQPTEPPIAEADVDKGVICDGENIQLSANSMNNASYTWTDLNTGIVVSNLQNPFIQALDETTTFELTVSVDGCPEEAKDNITIMVNKVPEISNVIGGGTYCAGETIILSAQADNIQTGQISYTWTGPNVNYTNTVPANTTLEYAIPEADFSYIGTYTLNVVTEDNCESTEESLQVDIQNEIQKPELAINENAFCIGETISLESSPSSEPNPVYKWYFNGNLLATTSVPNYSFQSTSVLNSGDYEVEIEAGLCGAANSDAVTVTIFDPTEEPTVDVGSSSTVCEGEQLSLNIVSPVDNTVYSWYDINGNFIINGVSLAIDNLSFNQSGEYFVEANSNGCGIVQTTVEVDVIQSIPTPNISVSNDMVCEGGEVVLSIDNNAIVNSAIYNWYDSNENLVSQTNTPTLTLSNVSSSDNDTYSVIVEVGDCTSAEANEVSFTVVSAPNEVANAGADESTCQMADFRLAATNPAFGTGTWTSPTATIIQPNNPNTEVTNLTQGPNVFVWTLTSSTCGVYSRDSVWVTFTTAPNESANIIQDQISICQTMPVEIVASIPTVSMGTWSQSSGPTAVTFTDPNSTSTTLNNLSPGIYVFSWSLEFANCGVFSTDQVVVQVDELLLIPANAGVDITICGDQQVLNLNAIAPSVGTGMWTSQTANIEEPNNPNSAVTNLQEGANVFTWAVSNGACTNYSADQVIVNFLQQPSDEAQVLQSNLTICESEIDNFSLEAVANANSTGTWIQTSGPAAITIDQPNNFSTSVQGLRPGTFVFEWVLSFGSCGDYDRDELEITVDAVPENSAEAGEDMTVCGDQEINLSALNPSIGTGVWTSADVAIADPNDPFSAVSNLNLGLNTFTWTLSNGSCQDYSSDVMIINYLEEPEEQALILNNNIIICETELSTFLLNAVSPTQADGTWSQTSGPTTVIIDQPNDANTSVQGMTSGTYTFDWSLSFGTCGTYSDASLSIQVSEVPDEVAQTQMDVVSCGMADQEITALTPSVGSGFWTSATSTIIDPTSPNTMVSLVPGTNTFVWTLSNGACEDYSSDELVIEYTASPTEQAQILTSDMEVCASDLSDIQLTAQTPSQSTGQWTMITGPNVPKIENPENIQTTVEDLVAGTYVFAWTLSAGSCVDFSLDQVTIEVIPVPDEDALVIESDIVTCASEDNLIEAFASNLGTGMWTSPTGAVIVSPNEPLSQVTNLQIGENIFVWSLSNGVCQNYSQDIMTITVEESVFANNDIYSIDFDQTLIVTDIVNNDELNGVVEWETNIVSQPSSGTITFNTDGTFDYVPDPTFSGQISFDYEICNVSCGTCDPATITIMVNREDNLECHVPNILTPNQDNKNDVLMISCVSQYPNNQICIFNRWGDQIYEVDSYQNDWGGQYDGNDLPAGTYFYVFKTSPEDQNALTGYITILR